LFRSIFYADNSAWGILWSDIALELRKRNTIISGGSGHVVRFVTHMQTPASAVARLLAEVEQVVQELKKKRAPTQ